MRGLNHERTSHRHILRATSIVGGATFAALLIALVRNKAVALVGGPEAVGLFGLFTALIATAASMATVGLDTSAVRQLSKSIADPLEAIRVRWAIWTIAWPLAIVGAIGVWLAREPLALLAIGNSSFAGEIGWLALGVGATVIGAPQMALLQSYGRIGDVARVRLWGSVFATAVSIPAIYRFGVAGLVVAALAAPLVNVALAARYSARLPQPQGERPGLKHLVQEWRALLTVGATVMLTYALANLSSLSVRAIITHQRGLDAAGFYHASSAIMSVNLTLVLNAMVADYYPRLSRVTKDPRATTDLVNQQLHVALVLAAPALTVASLAAVPLLQLLYSSAFSEGGFLLRLFVAAAIPRLLLWTLSYALLASGAAGAFLMGEIAGATVVPLTWLLVFAFGLPGAGVAAALANILIFATYFRSVSARDVRVSRENLRYSAFLFAFLLAVAFLFEVNMWAALLVGAAGGAAITWRSFGELRSILGR